VAPSGWLDGLAGCLAAMTAVHTELGSAAAADAARASADQLAALVERTGGRCLAAAQPVPPGFASGPAGVGWALARFGAITGDPAYREAGRRAVRCAVAPATGGVGDGSPGWCRGAAGLLVARSCLGDTGLHREGQLLIQRLVLPDLSLCHGEADITEALTMLTPGELAPTARTSTRQDSRGLAGLPPPWRHRAGLMVSALGRHTRFCGTPGGVPTPGLLRGLAGVGYGLLRAGFTERVPSVLFLEPTPAPTRRQSRLAQPANQDHQCQSQGEQ
jgi:class II lanthipeptide synthase